MLDYLNTLAIFAQSGALGNEGSANSLGTAAGGATDIPPQVPGGGFELWVIGAMFLVMYFVLIRPQQKRQKAHTGFVDLLKKGDNIITQSGIYGRISEMDGAIVTLEIAKNTHIKILKTQLACLQHGEKDGGVEKDKEVLQSPR